MKMPLLVTLSLALLAACQTAQSIQTNPNSRAAAGSSAGAPSQLNTIWALKQLNGKVISKAQFPRQLPYIDVNMRDNRVTGFTGCNRFSGAMQVTASTIKLGPLMSTKMACETIMSIETDFLNGLQTADTYKIDGKNITLFQGTTELMTLAKGD